MAANLRLTRGAIVSERVNAVLAPLLGKTNAKRLLAEVTAAAERDGTDLADLLTVALEEAGVAGPNVAGLFDPSGYTGMSGPLVDRALERFEKVLTRRVRMNDVAALEFTRQHAQPIPAERREELLATPGFGDVFSDHMVTVRWHAELGWHDARSGRSPRSRCTRPPWHCTTARRFSRA